jgi:tetratricopeptide (TPR) repeat protein
MILVRGMAWWPGFLNLWYRGEIYSLAISFLFATILNIAILATMVWPEWLAVWFVRALWILLAFSGLWSFSASFFTKSGMQQSLPSVECDNLFAEAQSDYLKGQYFEAEATLHRILASGAEDVEAALLLASVLRRTGRFRQAIDCLERLERFDSARYWTQEIADVRRRCEDSPAIASI